MTGIRDIWLARLRQSRMLQSVLLLAAWLLVWEVGYLVEYTPHVSVWFPVAGLTFAALLVMGPAAIPALLVGCVVITFATRQDYSLPLTDLETVRAGLLFGVAHLTPYGVATTILRVMVGRGVRSGHHDITRLVVTFLGLAAVSSLLTASLVLPSLVLSDMMAPAEVPQAWLPFWVGDMAGVMALAPLFTGALARLLPDRLFDPADLPTMPFEGPSTRFRFVFSLTLAVLVSSMLLAAVTRLPNSAFAIFFLVVPHMWIASSESPMVNALAVAFTSFLIAFLVHMLQLMDFVMVYQFAISVIAANTLFGLAVPALIADNLTLRRAAYTDRLTRVASREQVERQAARDRAACEADDAPMSLLVLDADRLKVINDTYGHQAGDAALQRLCHIVRQSLRAGDTLGRVGGDEFVVLLPHTSGAHAEQIAARIREQLGHAPPTETGTLTASMGVAEWRAGDSYETVFARADAALYQDKLLKRTNPA